jgi:hypothetical protein
MSTALCGQARRQIRGVQPCKSPLARVPGECSAALHKRVHARLDALWHRAERDPISGLPEIGLQERACRVNPTCMDPAQDLLLVAGFGRDTRPPQPRAVTLTPSEEPPITSRR